MVKKVFAVYDSKAEFYKNPFMVLAKGEAVRAFMDISNDANSEIGKHPEDFTLFYIADYDELKGSYTSLPTPVSCGVAIEYVNKVVVKDNVVSLKS